MDEFDEELLATHRFQQAASKASKDQPFDKEADIEATKNHFTGLGQILMAMIERLDVLETALDETHAIIADVEQYHGVVQDGISHRYVAQRYKQAHEIYEKVKHANH